MITTLLRREFGTRLFRDPIAELGLTSFELAGLVRPIGDGPGICLWMRISNSIERRQRHVKRGRLTVMLKEAGEKRDCCGYKEV